MQLPNRLIWSLLAVFIALLTLLPPVSAAPQSAPPTCALGPATDFNLFIRNTITQSGSDTEGRVAAGGAINFSAYDVGLQLDSSWNGQDILIAGGSLTFNGGAVHRGDAVYGTTSNVTNVTIDGVLEQGTPIDFNAAFTQLQNSAATLAALPANGTTTVQFGGITLTGSNATQNVFALNGSDLAVANQFTINAPAGSSVVVNINGTADQMANFGFFLNGVTRDKVLYNFYQATTLHLTGVGVEGSILAPTADVTFPSGVLQGTLVAKSLSGQGQLNHRPYSACPQGGSTPTPVAPTETPIPTSTPTPTNPIVRPILECVVNKGNGVYTAHFGYLNEGSNPVTIPIGANNKFTPAPQDRGQPTVFQPGRTDYWPNNAFSVDFPTATNLVWTLNGRTTTASQNSTPCSYHIFIEKHWYDTAGNEVPVPTTLPSGFSIVATSSIGSATCTYPANGSTLNCVYNNQMPPALDNNGLWVPLGEGYTVTEHNLPTGWEAAKGTGGYEAGDGYCTNGRDGIYKYCTHRVENAPGDTPPPGPNCTYTQGYWKNHAAEWPVTSLTIGNVTYTQAQLLTILNTPPRGDATYILAHQLIATKLNILHGADGTDAQTTVAAADAYLITNPIGSNPTGSVKQQGIVLANALDQYNNGVTGPGHCPDEPILGVTLASFDAVCQAEGINLLWETASEQGTLGFNLHRSTDPTTVGDIINDELILSQSPGGGQGADYAYLDMTVADGTYYYWLEDIDLNGASNLHGPVSDVFPCTPPTAITLTALTIAPAFPVGQDWGAGLALIALAGVGVVLMRRK